MEASFVFTVEGGKVTTGKPIGPAIYPLGVDINAVVAEINKITKQYDGVDVKIEIDIDQTTRKFRVLLVKPKTTDLIKQNSLKNIITVKKLHEVSLITGIHIKELEGTCKSMHIKVV